MIFSDQEKKQITMHPLVCFYRQGDSVKRHNSIVFFSDDVKHDHYAVQHVTELAIEKLNEVAPSVERIYIFSDGCASQYKGKGTSADLSLYTSMSQINAL